MDAREGGRMNEWRERVRGRAEMGDGWKIGRRMEGCVKEWMDGW